MTKFGLFCRRRRIGLSAARTSDRHPSQCAWLHRVLPPSPGPSVPDMAADLDANRGLFSWRHLAIAGAGAILSDPDVKAVVTAAPYNTQEDPTTRALTGTVDRDQTVTDVAAL